MKNLTLQPCNLPFLLLLFPLFFHLLFLLPFLFFLLLRILLPAPSPNRTLVNNHIFFQHPDLIRILCVHENVMAVMMNTLGRRAQAVGETQTQEGEVTQTKEKVRPQTLPCPAPCSFFSIIYPALNLPPSTFLLRQSASYSLSQSLRALIMCVFILLKPASLSFSTFVHL